MYNCNLGKIAMIYVCSVFLWLVIYLCDEVHFDVMYHVIVQCFSLKMTEQNAKCCLLSNSAPGMMFSRKLYNLSVCNVLHKYIWQLLCVFHFGSSIRINDEYIGNTKLQFRKAPQCFFLEAFILNTGQKNYCNLCAFQQQKI